MPKWIVTVARVQTFDVELSTEYEDEAYAQAKELVQLAPWATPGTTELWQVHRVDEDE